MGSAAGRGLGEGLLAAVLVSVFVNCGGGGGGGGDDDVRAVEPNELVPALLTEADEVGLTSYGLVPMTAQDPDEYYNEPPTQLCDAADEVELVGPNDLYAYMGDGGDYLYMDQWMSGETVEAATERYAAGVEALAACAEESGLSPVEAAHPELDELRRYESSVPSPQDSDEHSIVLYARNGGVIMLQSMYIARNDKYDAGQRDHLTDVALAKLADLGRVEVAAS